MTKEINIKINADGSYAIEELRKTSAAIADLGKSGKQIEPLDKELNKTSEAVADLSEAADKAEKKIDKLDKELNKAGKEAFEAAKNIDKAEEEVAGLGQSAGSTGKIIERLDKIVDHFGSEANETGKKIDRLEKDLSELGKEFDKASKNVDRLEKELQDLGEENEKNSKKIKATTTTWTDFATGINQVWEIAGKAKRALSSGWELAKQGTQLQEARSSFDDYAKSVGTSSAQIISKLKQASGGTIDDMSLIVTASKSMSLGVTQDADKMGNLLLIARNKARLFGMDTTQAFNDIVTGIGRSSPLILDNLGIRIPAGFEQMTDGMSDAEKVAKLLELTLIEGNKQLADMGGLTNSSADDIRVFEAEIVNLKASLGALLAETFIPFTREIRSLIPDIKALMDQVKLLVAVANVPGQIAATLYYDKDIKKNPESLADAQSKYYAVQAEITAIRSKMAGIKPDSKAGWLADAAKYSAGSSQLGSLLGGVDSYIGLDSKSRELQDYADQLELMIVQLENAEKKLAQKSFADSLFAGLEKEFSDTKAFSDAIFADLERDLATELNKNGDTKKKTGKAAKELKEQYIGLFDATKSVYDMHKNLPPTLARAEAGFKKVVTALGDVISYSGASGNELLKIPFVAAAKEAAELVNSIELIKSSMSKGLSNDSTRFAKDAVSYLQKGVTGYFDFMQAGQERDLWDAYGGNILSMLWDTSNVKKLKEIENPFADTIASAVTAGFQRADFSGFLTSLGSGLSGVVGGILTDTIQSAISGKNTGSFSGGESLLNGLFKPAYTKNAAGQMTRNWGNIGSNLAIGGAISFLTSPGRLFGGSITHGEEHFGTSSSLNDQVTQAKDLRDQLYIQAGISETTRRLLEDAEFYYSWVRKTKSGNGITSKKTTTYLLEGTAQAQASIDNIKKLQESVIGEQTRRSYDLWQLSRTDNLSALQMSANDAEAAYNATFVKNMSDSEVADLRSQQATWQSHIVATQQNAVLADSRNKSAGAYGWQFGNPYQSQIAAYQQRINDLEAKIQEGQGYKYSEAERTSALKAYEQAKIDLAAARESGRTSLIQPFLSSNTLAGLTSSDLLSQMLGDTAIGSNKDMIKTMLPLLKEAGLADFDLASQFAAAGSDPEKLAAAGQREMDVLNKAVAMYEKIWKDAEQEALNASKTIEEQNAAFERFQAAQSALLATKESILQKEQELAAIDKQKLESQRNAQIETALSAIGEIDKRGNKMIVLSDNDAIVAIDALIEEFADNPEVTAILQKKRQTEVAKAKWGSMA